MSNDENDNELEAYRDWQAISDMGLAEEAARLYASKQAMSDETYWMLYKAYLQGWQDGQS